MQNFVTWPNFGTQAFWDGVLEEPGLALKLMCHLVNQLGAINPSEHTSREVAACAAVAMHRGQCPAVAADELNRLFDNAKASTC